jgi:glycogen debranching enzyme-like protein
MVARQWTRRLCGWDDRRQLDPALSHGLLIAPVASPLGCRLILAKADATLIDGAHSWPLFTNRWKSGDIAPAGHVRIGSFHLDYSVPVWTYEVGDRQIEARIWMEPGAHTIYAAWLLRPGADPPEDGLSLRVTLLANDRDHHGATSVGGFEPEMRVDDDRLLLTDAGLFSLAIRAPGGAVVPKRDWYRDFDLRSKPSAAWTRRTVICASAR